MPQDFVYYPEVIRVLDSEFEDLLTHFDKSKSRNMGFKSGACSDFQAKLAH